MPLEAKKKISVDVALIDKSVHFSPMQYFYYFFFLLFETRWALIRNKG